MAKLNEGASILLTWIINLIKWNAGVVKYKFRLLNERQSQMQTAQLKESLEHGHRTDDLAIEDGQHSLSQQSDGEGRGGMYPFNGQRESTGDGQNSDDEDDVMNYKFAAAGGQGQQISSSGGQGADGRLRASGQGGLK